MSKILSTLLISSLCAAQEVPAMRFTNLWSGKLVAEEIVEVKVAIYGKPGTNFIVQINGVPAIRETNGMENFIAPVPFPQDGIITAVTQGRTISATIKRPLATVRYMTATSIADMIIQARGAGDVPIVFTFAPGTYRWPLSQPGGFLTRQMPIMITGGRSVIIQDAWPEISHSIFANVRIEPTTTAPALYSPTNSLVEVLGCEIAPPNNQRQSFQSRGIGLGNGRRIVIGNYFHHLCLPIIGSEFVQGNVFDEIGEVNINSPGGLIEGNIGLGLRAWLPQVHVDTIQWFGGNNFNWDNIICRHNIFLNQEAQGFFAHGQRLTSFAIVGNIMTWGGTDRYHGMFLDTCTSDNLFLYHNTIMGAYDGLLISNGSLTNSCIVNNVFNGDATSAAMYVSATNIVDYNASTNTNRPVGPHSIIAPAAQFAGPFMIPIVGNPVLGAGLPVLTCLRTFGLLNYSTPPQIGFINRL